MNARTVTVAVGTTLLIDGEGARVVEFDGRKVVVSYADGRYASVAVAEFVSRARSLEPVDRDVDPGLVLADLSPEDRSKATERAAHIREVLTGYRSGYAEAAADGEPHPAYAASEPFKARCAAKARELSVAARTIERWVAAYRDAGEAGLVDDRQRRGRRSKVDPRWDAAVRAELAARVSDSTPTRSAVLMRVTERLEREHGAGAVPIPAKTTAYRRLGELAKGTNAVSGSAKARRSIADRPQGVYGRLRATRPGEYLILDTQDLDVFAMEPVTCRWVRAQLTVAQDLFDRQILGLKVTPVSTKAIDVAGVLFEAVTGRSSGRPALGPVHGLPDHLVFTENGADPEIWCPPETLVIDHGKAFLSSHVIGVCARLGISIQPAQSRKPTDKPTVERFFRSLREGLIQHLPAYKGPDLHSRGEGLEGKAFLFLHELEDVIRDWITTAYHRSGHDGLAVAEWPELAMSPNDMFAVGLAKAGLLRIPADPALAFEFLRVVHRTIQHYGVEIGGRRYNGAGLDGHRNATSPYGGLEPGKWPIRVNDDDVRYVYFQDPDSGDWHRLDWEHAPMLDTPFSDEAARYARVLARRTDRFVDPVEALGEVLARWSAGEVLDRRERRIAARLSAERSGLATAAELELASDPVPALPGPGDPVAPIVGDDDDDDEIFDGSEEFDDDAAADFYADALEVLE
ncbi:DDE-type integrase/transposase/recombinase [Nocardia africana]|uniref:Integrase core domain n=1 Tax=Nocardia africana TaxID=134964 RepID=A0A378X1Q5_9NOCA|nr:DDE-type integrase/transposase/recombinase [Nocardia africana]MCC3318316.1 DDE-type integrase/transposase/recombinase [Nocardia africana]SUA47379.1 Integrase core domain [Nocardia africana]